VLQQPPDENELGRILLDLWVPGLSGPALHSCLLELGSADSVSHGLRRRQRGREGDKADADDFPVKPVKLSSFEQLSKLWRVTRPYLR
jgi:hypothetical protein